MLQKKNDNIMRRESKTSLIPTERNILKFHLKKQRQRISIFFLSVKIYLYRCNNMPQNSSCMKIAFFVSTIYSVQVNRDRIIKNEPAPLYREKRTKNTT
jgi:hypothetical protein